MTDEKELHENVMEGDFTFADELGQNESKLMETFERDAMLDTNDDER